jgi:hypothetical protein
MPARPAAPPRPIDAPNIVPDSTTASEPRQQTNIEPQDHRSTPVKPRNGPPQRTIFSVVLRAEYRLALEQRRVRWVAPATPARRDPGVL